MKLHDESIARGRHSPTPSPSAGRGSQLTAACAGLAIVVLLWAFGSRLYPCYLHPDARSRAAVTRLWDKHQDLTQAVAAIRPAIRPAPFRRQPKSPTRIAAPCGTTIRLASAAYRPAGERRPVTLFPHLAQVRLRAPPPVLA